MDLDAQDGSKNLFQSADRSTVMQKLSVVMSVYKNDDPKYFLEAISSILNQSLPAQEIILAADGPLGESLGAAVTEVAKNPLVSVIWLPENLGLGAARHRSILDCSGDLVAVMDADDLSVQDRFESQLAIFQEIDVDIVGGFIREYSENGEAVRKVPLEHQNIFSSGRNRSPFNHVTVMFKREAYLRSGGYKPIRGVEDYDLWHRMLMGGCRGMNIPKVLVNVRFGASDIGRRRGLEYLKSCLNLLWDMYQSGYIGLGRLLGLGFLQTVTRLSPHSLVRIYYLFLRSRNRIG